MSEITFARHDVVVVAGDPGDYGSGKGLTGERIEPGMLGSYDFADALGTVHVRWETGLRRGLSADQSVLLRPVAALTMGEILMTLMPDAASVVMVCRNVRDADPAAPPAATVPAGQYLRSWDPDAAGGNGMAEWTPSPRKALVFASVREAYETWRTVPSGQPVRPDGFTPNRPLTAFEVAFVPADTAGGAE